MSRQRKILDTLKFRQTQRPELVVYSTLRRSEDTAYGLFRDDDENEGLNHFFRHPELYEKCFAENIGYRRLRHRIERFEKWLASRPEERIAIVGHGTFFRAMIGVEDQFDNVDVWKSTFDIRQTEPSKRWFESRRFLSGTAAGSHRHYKVPKSSSGTSRSSSVVLLPLMLFLFGVVLPLLVVLLYRPK